MNGYPTAEIIAAHAVLSSPAAIAWRDVIDGEISADEAAALLDDGEERELAQRVFVPPTPERREALLESLLAAANDETP